MFMSSILRKIKNLLSFQWLVLIYRMYLQKLARFQVIWPMLSRRLLGFNCRAYYWKRCGCKLGKNVNIGWDVYFDVHNAHLITIEDDVWIGRNVLMTPGRHIAKGSIIAAGCVLTKDFPEYSIIGGNPGKFIRSRLKETN